MIWGGCVNFKFFLKNLKKMRAKSQVSKSQVSKSQVLSQVSNRRFQIAGFNTIQFIAGFDSQVSTLTIRNANNGKRYT